MVFKKPLGLEFIQDPEPSPLVDYLKPQ